MGYGMTFAIIFGAIGSIAIIATYQEYKVEKARGKKLRFILTILSTLLGIAIAYILGNSL
jgi:hypothetical protein